MYNMKLVPIGQPGIHITREIFDGLTTLDAVTSEMNRIRMDDSTFGERKRKSEIVVNYDEYLAYLNKKKQFFEKKKPTVSTRKAISTTKASSVKELEAKIKEQNIIIKELLTKVEAYPRYYTFNDSDDVKNLLDEVFDKLNPNEDAQLEEDLMVAAIVRGVFGDNVAKQQMGDAYKILISEIGE